MWVSAPFTPPMAFASSQCIDTDLPWAYSIDTNGADLDVVRTAIDKSTSLVWVMLDPSGSGPVSMTMTLHAALPTGESASFVFQIVTPSACPLIPPVFTDHTYKTLSPLAGYDPPPFGYTTNCPIVPITYSNSISPVTGSTWISSNSGIGKLVEWQTNDPLNVN